LRSFASAVAGYDRRSLAATALLQLAATVAQGVGLLLLVPLLEVAGIGDGRTATPTSGVAGIAASLLGTVGVSLTLRSLLTAYVLIVAVAASLQAYASVRIVRYRLDFVDALRERLYRAVAVAEWRHLVSLRQSDVLSTVTMDVTWMSLGAQASLMLAVTTILIVVQLVVALRISPLVTALAAGTGAGLIAITWPLVARSRRLGREQVDSNRGVLAAVTGFLDGLKLAKAHGLEPGHVGTFGTAIRRSRRSQIAFTTAQSVSTAVQLVVTAVVLAILVTVAVEQFHLALAGLLVVAFIFSRLLPQITSAQQNVHQVAQSLPAFSDLLAFIDGCEAAGEPLAEPDGRRLPIGTGVRLEGVGFSYGDTPVLHDVSFEIAAQRTIALVGPSGAGKTTLADIVVGLVPPTAGQLLVDGRPLADGDLRAWRASIALVPQDPFLFHGTVRDNLAWARADATEAEMWGVLATAAAEDFVRELPHRLDTVVGDRGARLSGGERQRIAMARALLRRPDLLVLDEATSALDTENELAIRSALTGLHGHTTMLVIAHRLSTVSSADVIVVLDAGRVVETGTWADLAARGQGRLRSLIDAGSVG